MTDLNDYNSNTVWIVDGKKYISKTDALIASADNNSKIDFDYYNKEFDDFDWTVEPIESFKELAKQRAQQLRDSNKYLRLWYSGGADSHTVLQTFLTNNIFLDEIVMVRTSPIDDFDGFANQETNLRSMPYINSIRYDIPNTKISLVKMFASQYLEYYKTEEWFKHTLGTYCFADDPGVLLSSRRNLEKYGNLKVPPGTVEITGNIKPKVIRHEGVYYTIKNDTNFHFLHWSNVRDFYTTHEFLKLHSKQCHELKHIVEKWYPTGNVYDNIYNPELIDPKFKTVWYNCCRQIINPEVDFGGNNQLFSPKTLLRIQEAKEHNPELFKYFIEPLRELQKKIPNSWPDFDQPLKVVFTSFINLGPYPGN